MEPVNLLKSDGSELKWQFGWWLRFTRKDFFADGWIGVDFFWTRISTNPEFVNWSGLHPKFVVLSIPPENYYAQCHPELILTNGTWVCLGIHYTVPKSIYHETKIKMGQITAGSFFFPGTGSESSKEDLAVEAVNWLLDESGYFTEVFCGITEAELKEIKDRLIIKLRELPYRR